CVTTAGIQYALDF
nr:immunoglobulin heavy chain junction region [Macaca mulatta]MOV39627.1 immunoglobulin heavy chain junction region [Macaca mulatta]MOV40429.1 immunoglobulin heavy chain junction region [Macaca mulatta]MOV42272.1 immunoglobulin heavy chain junction region [Macaca mulatta]MOV46860.1 immunoglobulin heavy chain junction region [Macaca mulatta]